ncbi:MAG: hypothetical protein WKG01_30480 [Kofleriaceae bacterium]
MSAVCPSCGVAVVPGYQRCPKCRAALPYGTGRIKRVTSDPGGTTVRESGFPIMAALIGAIAIALAVVLIFGLGGKDKKKPKRAVPVTQEPMARVPSAPVPTAPVEAAPPIAVPAPDPNATAASLERALQRQRLWSTVEAYGSRVDIRSAACSEPGMTAMIDAARDPLRAAGLTRVRCLAQSGAVVLERDL